MVEIFYNTVSGIIRQWVITQFAAQMNELGFRFGFGLYMISCIIIRERCIAKSLYHGLAAKKASGQVRSIFFIQPTIFSQFMHPYYYIISFLARDVERQAL
jgi:hypothetical protein